MSLRLRYVGVLGVSDVPQNLLLREKIWKFGRLPPLKDLHIPHTSSHSSRKSLPETILSNFLLTQNQVMQQNYISL